VEVFLQFLYTNLIKKNDFEQFLIELCDLSVYFQAGKLIRFCAENFQQFLCVDNMKAVVTWSFIQASPTAQDTLSDFIASNFEKLVAAKFSFYKIGKTVMLKVLKSIAAAQTRPWNFSSSTKRGLGVSIGQPSTHPQYDLLLNGNYSDFRVKLNHFEYHLHKCILFVQSGYFQSFLKSDWKESSSGEITIPGNEISKKSFEAFLAFLYTNYITEKDLETNLFELYFLSDYFQVQTMKILVLHGFEKYLTNTTAESFLTCIRDREIFELKGRMADYLAAHFMELLKIDFPFHKVGKIILQRMFSRVAAHLPGFRRSFPSSIRIIGVYSQGQLVNPITEDDSEIPDF
jgi:hypothetical protein